MSKGGWQRPLIDATLLWMALFPAIKILADQVRTRSLDFSGATYFWAYAFRGGWSAIAINLACVAVCIVVTAALLRVTRKSLFA